MIAPPNVDGRRVERFVRALHTYAPGYTPDLDLSDSGGAGTALMRIFAHLAESIAVRLDRAPQKHLVAFLDALGVIPVPARAVRAPVTFKLASGLTTAVTVPAGTRVTAAGADDEIPFETASELIAIPGALSTMYGFDPAADAIVGTLPDFLTQQPRSPSALLYEVVSFAGAGTDRLQLNHITDLQPGAFLHIDCREKQIVRKIDEGNIVTLEGRLAGDVAAEATVTPIRNFEVFNGVNLQEHVLYIGHSRVLTVKSTAVIRVAIGLQQVAGQPLDVVWQFWTKNETAVPDDEEHWHDLMPQSDGTNGFTSSGDVVLVKPADLEIKPRQVEQRENRWIRAKLRQDLTSGDSLPEIDSIQVGVASPSTDPLPGIPADQGFYNATPLDVQVEPNVGFFPFGTEPRQFDQFYVASKEAFSKRGAKVALEFAFDLQTLASPSTALIKSNSGHDLKAYAVGQRRRLYELNATKGEWTILGDPSQQPNSSASQPSRYLPVRNSVPTAVADETGAKTFVFVNTDDALDRDAPNKLWVLLRPTGGTPTWVNLDAPPPPSSAKKQIKFDPAAVRLADGSGFARVFVVAGDGTLYSQVVSETPVGPAPWEPHGAPMDAALTSPPCVVREPTTNTLLVYVRGVSGADESVYEYRFSTANPWTRLQGVVQPRSRPFAQAFAKAGRAEAKVFVVGTAAPNAPANLFECDTSARIAGVFDWIDLGRPSVPDNANLQVDGDPTGYVEEADKKADREGKHVFVRTTNNHLYERLDDIGGTSRWQLRTKAGDPHLRGSPSVAVAPAESVGRTRIEVLAASVRNSLVRWVFENTRGTVAANAAGRAVLLSNDTPPGDHNDKTLTIFDNGTQLPDTPTIEAYDETRKLAKIEPPALPPIDDTLECAIAGDEPRLARADAKNIIPVHDPIDDDITANVVDLRLDEAPKPGDFYSRRTGLLALEDISDAGIGTRYSLYAAIFRAGTENRPPEETDVVPDLSWEYWNGRGWLSIPRTQDATRNFLGGGGVTFPKMPAVEATEVAGQNNFWIRARLVGGDYGRETFRVIKDQNGNDVVISDKSSLHPPKIATLRITYTNDPVSLEACLTFNNLNYLEQTAASQLSSAHFPPFQRLDEKTRTLFFGFDATFKSGLVRLLLDAAERDVDPHTPPAFRWQFRRDHDWRDMAAEDESQALTRPGLLTLSAPDELTRETLFGRSLFWTKGTLREDRGASHADYPNPLLRGVFLNTVWTVHGDTVTDEIVASSDGEPGQRHSLQHGNVLRDQDVRVLEPLSVEEREQIQHLEGADSIVDRDDIGGPWVRWKEARAFFDAAPTDRCYAIDRAAGVLRFGDGVHGRVPPAGVDNIRAFRYRSGGGATGNVDAGAIKTLATAVQGIESVFNPTPAGGGSDTATTEAMLQIGPQQISHRDRAVSPEDFEKLAVEVSRQVAKARCLATTNLLRATNQPDPCHPAQRHVAHAARGWVSVIVVPNSRDPQPCPSLELRRTVLDYLRERAPSLLVAGDRLIVRPPDYVVVCITADVFVASLERASAVERQAVEALQKLLHPLDGGPEGRGWEFGRPIAASDVFAVLEAIGGVDRIQDLRFHVGGRDCQRASRLNRTSSWRADSTRCESGRGRSDAPRDSKPRRPSVGRSGGGRQGSHSATCTAVDRPQRSRSGDHLHRALRLARRDATVSAQSSRRTSIEKHSHAWPACGGGIGSRRACPFVWKEHSTSAYSCAQERNCHQLATTI